MKQFDLVRCPYCFQELRANNVVFRANPWNKDNKMTDPYLKVYHRNNGDDTYEEPMFGYVDPAAPDNADLGLEIDDGRFLVGIENPDKRLGGYLEKKLCPFCHNRLARLFGRARTYNIAVIGVPASGKTTYIAALQDSLSHHFTWRSLDPELNKGLEDLAVRYAAGEDAARTATKDIQGPYFYELEYKQNNADQKQHVVFYDVPGEYYTHYELMQENLIRFLRYADGIIFVIDMAGSTSQQADIQRILGILQANNLSRNKKIAILFNKADKAAIEDAAFREVLEAGLTPITKGQSIDLKAIDKYAWDVQNIHLNFGAGIMTDLQKRMQLYMNTIVNTFGQNSYKVFITRLLSEQSDSSTYTFRSDGAETPFFWLLAQNNAFPHTP